MTLEKGDHDVDLTIWAELVPENWNLDPLRAAARVADRTAETISSSTMVDPMRDTVTNAPELARLTQNLAPVHRDPSLGPGARRLVYGGHTVGLAQASVVRLLPDTATFLGWQSCDHPAPVFENDVLSFRHTLLDEQPVAEGRLRAFRTEVRPNGPTGPLRPSWIGATSLGAPEARPGSRPSPEPDGSAQRHGSAIHERSHL
ncbi:MAG: hypothetical protein CM1200mP26_06790 [Acidimicrobiales bacterium]|nr:MAG: hypothetical protein CM1200mP26_06790 [Acidimicrobiales bacterium]